MIIVNISGGLGNQLFQLALFNKLLEENNEKVKIDISFYKDQNSLLYFLFRKIRGIPSRKFLFEDELKEYIISRKFLLQSVFGSFFISALIKILSMFIPIKYILKLSNAGVINETNIGVQKFTTNIKIYDGYWQSKKFVVNQDGFIRSLLKAKYGAKFCESPTHKTVIHIRRGDQASKFSKDIYTVLDLDYYNSAVNQLIQTGENFNELIICSDDIDWCIKNVKSINGITNIKYSNSKTMLEDFLIMYNAKYLISSNSTFSWWAGYLGNCKKLIIPKNWYSREPKMFINNSNKILEI